MTDFIVYCIKANCIALVLYAFYYLLLRNNTFYVYKRIYFGLGVLTVFLLPLLNLSAYFTVRTALVLPLDFPLITGELTSTDHTVSVSQCIVFTALAGTILLLLRFAMQLVSLAVLLRSSTVQYAGNCKVYCINNTMGPFSFFNYIFVNPELYNETDLQEIIAHERAHARQLHCADIIGVELLTAMFWYNPLVWLFRRACKQNTEFLADAEVLQQGCNKQHYQYTLLRVSKQPVNLTLVNSFTFNNLKQRIVMMNRKQSHRYSLLRFVLLVPVLFGTVWVVNAHQHSIEESSLLSGIVMDKGEVTGDQQDIFSEIPVLRNILNKNSVSGRQSLSILPMPAFNKSEHDFGTIEESDGLVSCYFTFMNVGGSPLIISSVKASCSCTAPEWTKAPVPPGGVGYIKATYNPYNRVYPFNRTLTIFYNGSPSSQMLRITGNVVRK